MGGGGGRGMGGGGGHGGMGGGRRHGGMGMGGGRHYQGYHSGGFGRRGYGYWGRGFGYGFGLWYAWRYPWIYGYFTPWYTLWYPPYWVPSYVVDEQTALAYDERNRPIPSTAYLSNEQAFGQNPANLPGLPTFDEARIDVSALHYNSQQNPSAEQERHINATIERINAALLELKHRPDVQTWMAKGYVPVPDMDRRQFSWIRAIQ